MLERRQLLPRFRAAQDQVAPREGVDQRASRQYRLTLRYGVIYEEQQRRDRSQR